MLATFLLSELPTQLKRPTYLLEKTPVMVLVVTIQSLLAPNHEQKEGKQQFLFELSWEKQTRPIRDVAYYVVERKSSGTGFKVWQLYPSRKYVSRIDTFNHNGYNYERVS